MADETRNNDPEGMEPTGEARDQIGPYEVVAPLGAGGMGEVYRARDTKLGREVAIKLLLDEVSADPDRLARFEREARVLASLNHPNIATLYGFESEGDSNFLVMELVEGETLADRIARGRIPFDEAIPLFLQMHRWYGENNFTSLDRRVSYHRRLRKIRAPWLAIAGSVDGMTPLPDVYFGYEQIRKISLY